MSGVTRVYDKAWCKENNAVGNFTYFIYVCHRDEYEVIRVTLTSLAGVAAGLAFINFLLIVYFHGFSWARLNVNARVRHVWMMALTIAFGM